MRPKSQHLFVVITLLSGAALACATVTGGGAGNGRGAQATANFLRTQGANLSDDAQATADAALGGLDGITPEATSDDGNNGDGNGDATATSENPLVAEGPADIPLVDDTNDILIAQPESLSYLTDAKSDDVVTFYKDEMPANGWELSPNGEFGLGGLTTLIYTQDTRTATIAITTDPTSNRTSVTVFVTKQ